MRIEVDHLPQAKQRDLERVVQILFEEFDAAKEHATGERRRGKILKIILYGSHARGDWVAEPHTAKGYLSDFDILVIVNQRDLTDRAAYWTRADERLIEEQIAGRLRTPTNFIVHSLQQVNDGLAHGRFFFMEIAADGIALYQSDDTELHRPKPKSPEDALDIAKEYFDEWLPSAMGRFKLARFAMIEGLNKHAAFEFHQATESLYHCILLVCTFYTPHNHNLVFLRKQAERLDDRLFDIWPRSTRADRAHFEKLKDAYVKARYSKHYRISADDLEWLAQRIEQLGQIVHTICSERIAALKVIAGRTD
jgi:predicted nucleotidyltransferase/HEPN domain-containing protein